MRDNVCLPPLAASTRKEDGGTTECKVDQIVLDLQRPQPTDGKLHCLHMRIYMSISTYEYICMHTHTYTDRLIDTQECVHMSVSECVCVCTYMNMDAIQARARVPFPIYLPT